MSGPRLASIPPHVPFLDALARRWLDAHVADPSRGIILLPTRRAARALAEAFLHVSGGRPMLLPRITAIGALDEAPLALAGALDLPPAVAPMRRLAALARLVMARTREAGGVGAADQAWALAGELARLMDEAEQAEVTLAEALARAHDGSYAQHWDLTLTFLRIVTDAWPAWLAEHGVMNPAARQVALLAAQAQAWRDSPPAMAIWAAGLTGAIPAVTRLLRVIAHLPHGQVVLPWWEPSDESLAQTHPQAGLQALLAGLGAAPGDVALWDAGSGVPAGRAALLSEALLPAPALHRWTETPPPDPGRLMLLEPADEQEEAVAVALVLREALAEPGQRAALVTPDRALAGRVAAELLRWGVVGDDSAGESLAETPPAVFLRLACRAAVEHLAPVALLALLKHPLAACGLSAAACRGAGRALDRALRGPRPPAGFSGLRQALESCRDPEAPALVERVRDALEPLLRFVAPQQYPPAELLRAGIEAAERLAATDLQPGAQLLWRGEEGVALADLLAEALPALEHLPPQPPEVLPRLLDALLAGEVIRSRRALRGRDGVQTEHPRVFIWGLLEARLQAADVVVLGGLTEGVWPPATEPGPWMSRPMRARAGLPGSEAAIGQAAHDFVMASCCAPVAVLSAPRRRDRAPAVPARWLARLRARVPAGFLARHPAVGWARALDLPEGGKGRPVEPPSPRPPVALRPRRFSVTDIETLIADPYAIYAKRILRLRKLDPLEQDTDALDYGKLVHEGIELFLRDHAARWPGDPARALRNALLAALQQAAVRPSIAAWWAPRLERIADWIAAEDSRRRDEQVPARIAVEQSGTWELGGFTITAKADRIERFADGTIAILDYKTGVPPDRKALHDGTAPQLPLEAAMAQAGAFSGLSGRVTALIYWHLTGGHRPGRAVVPLKTPEELTEVVANTPEQVAALLAGFDDPDHPYPHHPHPGRLPRNTDYAQLARARETAAADET